MNDNISDNRFPAEVLLVDDNESDALLIRRSLKQSTFAINFHHVENGLECMGYLRNEGHYTDVPTPDLILLDLNMPLMNDIEVLAEIIKDDKLNHLPVVVLTTSEDNNDVLSSYKLRCNSFITKPVDFIELSELLQKVCAYWFTVVTLPMSD